MLQRLSHVPGADVAKLTTIDGTTADLDPADLRVDLCLIDGEHTNAAALQDARFCRRAVRDQGVIVFHDRLIVDHGIQRFLAELSRYRAYPLAHDLFVVEIGVPSLPRRSEGQSEGSARSLADRRSTAGRSAGAASRADRQDRTARIREVGAHPRRATPQRAGRAEGVRPSLRFEVHTFVNDDGFVRKDARVVHRCRLRPGRVRAPDRSRRRSVHDDHAHRTSIDRALSDPVPSGRVHRSGRRSRGAARPSSGARRARSALGRGWKRRDHAKRSTDSTARRRARRLDWRDPAAPGRDLGRGLPRLQSAQRPALLCRAEGVPPLRRRRLPPRARRRRLGVRNRFSRHPFGSDACWQGACERVLACLRTLEATVHRRLERPLSVPVRGNPERRAVPQPLRLPPAAVRLCGRRGVSYTVPARRLRPAASRDRPAALA